MKARLCVALAWAVCSVAAAEWQAGSGWRSARLPSIPEHKPGFTKLNSKITGITFANHLANERSITNRNLLSGSGVAAGDIDGDGFCDLFFCRLDGPSVLYRNLGNWKFEDVTARAGVACAGQDSTGASFADIDGDNDTDLLVNALGNGTRIFQNDGGGTFTEVTQRAGVASKTGSTSMALADVDGDGDLDLYVANFRPTTVMDRPGTKFTVNVVGGKTVVTAVDGVPTSSPEFAGQFTVNEAGTVLESGEVDALYLNNGHGVFTSVSFTNGAFLDESGQVLRDPPRDWGLAVQFHDFTGDGAPDIYVCNDLFTPDRAWVNDGGGKFRALPTLALRNVSTFSMGVDFGDLNRDGHADFFVVDMLSPDHRKRQVQTGQSSPMWWPVGVIRNAPAAQPQHAPGEPRRRNLCGDRALCGRRGVGLVVGADLFGCRSRWLRGHFGEQRSVARFSECRLVGAHCAGAGRKAVVYDGHFRADEELSTAAHARHRLPQSR